MLGVCLVATAHPGGTHESQGQMSSVQVGQPAPNFVLEDTTGEQIRLSDYLGRVVVLEWFNPGCPFVKEVHQSGRMPTSANRALSQDVVWLAVNSGAANRQGAGLATNQTARNEFDIGYPILLDEPGVVGRAYGAKTTPQMFVIDATGTIIYAGAFDNQPMGELDGEHYRNHVDSALDENRLGQTISQPVVKPWGCSVKYAQ